MDLVVHVSHHPQAGETVLGSDLQSHPGGKGANQAVATARMGVPVRMVGCVGPDTHGQQLRQGLQQEGIFDACRVVSRPSGVALITVDSSGQNRIVVAPGANSQLLPTDLQPSDFVGAKAVLLQLEIPWATVLQATRLAQQAGALVLLNAAPIRPMQPSDLANVDVLVVNETEAAALVGTLPTQASQALEVASLLQRFVKNVVLTLGANGVVWASPQSSGHLPAHAVTVIDTTAAGDAFIGALAAQLAQGAVLEQAVRWGNAAGALATTKAGAQPSLPTKDEVLHLLAQAQQTNI